jgi:UDP-N-acetylmuramate dehydrogenase
MAIGGIAGEPTGGDTLIACGAGENWDRVVEYAVARDLAGIECLSGIPGTVGGTPIQNVGAYGQDVAGTIDSVTVFDRHAARHERMTASECRFGYRTSRFKTTDAARYIVCEVTLRLRHGAPTLTYPDVVTDLHERAIMTPTVADVRRAVLGIRRRKGMVLDPEDPDTRSVGSFFTNPVLSATAFARLQQTAGQNVPSFAAPGEAIKVPAAWLIERAGFARGFSNGAVGLSTKHPLAIVNRGGASAREVVAFAVAIKREVAARFDVPLTTEPVFAGFAGDSQVAYLTRGA